MTKIDMAFFPSVEGSMTSPDGQTFMLHVKRESGSDLLLGFPHSEIPTAHPKSLPVLTYCLPVENDLSALGHQSH